MNNHNQAAHLKLNKRQAGRSALSVLVFTSILLQAACVSNVSSATKQSDKDTTGAYDGQWLA